ncbi:MAG: hypothetical protein K0R48_967 [Gammaproteobacteria bacterium]|jgi:hypothetical protein|nr:hypothetical protein [Gammaproteobacteria bacterium]
MKFKKIILTFFLFLALAGCSTAGSAANGAQEQNFKAPLQNKIFYRRPTSYHWLKINNTQDSRGTMIHYVDVPADESVNHWTQTITEAYYVKNEQATAEGTAQEFSTYMKNLCQIEGWSTTHNSSKDITIKATVKNCQGIVAPDGYLVIRFWQGSDAISSLSYQARLAVVTESLKAEMVKTVANASLQSN